MKTAVRSQIATTSQFDLVAMRAVNELNAFGKWLKDNNAKGLISEIGWPNNADPQQWNRVVSAWFQAANRLRLPVLTFTAQGPSTNFAQLTMYGRSSGSVTGGQSINTPSLQAPVAEANLGTSEYWRGIDVFGGAANDGGGDGNPAIMSNTNQNTWWHETPGTYQYLASRGYTVARIGFRWERIQPILNAPLDSAELARLQNAVTNAGNAGMKVVLDLHNYARYVTAGGVRILGTSALPVSSFTDVWSRIATAFNGNSNVLAYSLMNEPHGMSKSALGQPEAQHWEWAAQMAVNAIRATSDAHEIHVSVYEWGHASNAALHHPTAWIVDPLNKILYEGHHYLYFNRSTAANYPDTFATEIQKSKGNWSRHASTTNTWAQWANLTWNKMEN